MKTDAFSDPTYRATLLRASPSPGPQAQAQGSIRGPTRWGVPCSLGIYGEEPGSPGRWSGMEPLTGHPSSCKIGVSVVAALGLALGLIEL